MKIIPLVAAALILGATGALAQTNQPGAKATPGGEQVHPPTNRVGSEVPQTQQQPDPNKPATGGEAVHPPTNRVGEAVPPGSGTPGAPGQPGTTKQQ